MTSDSANSTSDNDAGPEVENQGAEVDEQGADQQESAAEANKRRFREALEAKRGRDGADHIDADPHPTDHGHGPVNEKRTFRRKTG